MQDFMNFMPILLLWLVRLSLVILAYMYNSHAGLAILTFVLLSFILPIYWYYVISVWVILPLCLFQFLLVYVCNIEFFKDSKIFTLPLFEEYKFEFHNYVVELSFIYGNLMLVALMIPAKCRLDEFRKAHPEKDMGMQFFIQKVTANENIIWCFLVMFLLNLHTIVLFLLVYIGYSDDFTLFQLISMFFFVFYSASDFFFRKTSILLPIFISVFILGQYIYSLNYESMDAHKWDGDFYFFKHGWEPPADGSNYWARKPNINLWIMLVMMATLH